MESKALYTAIVFLLVCLASLFLFWASELNRESISFDDPVPLLEVEDKPLLTDAAKAEALNTGRAWFYRGDELVIMENVPEQYLED